MKLLPSTKLGKLSLKFVVGYFLIFIFTAVVIIGLFKQEGGETFSDNLYLSIPMFSAFGLVIAAFVTGIVSIIKYKERSLLVYLPIALGLLIAFFIVGKLATPH